MHGMILAPFVFTLAYILNTLRCPRMAYLLSWVIIIPLSFIGGLEEWIETSQYWISAGILCPLAVLISLRRRDNGDFTDAIIAYAASFGVAFVFALTIHLLVMAIFGSTAYIFDLKVPEALWFYVTLVAYGIVAPVMFLSLQHRLLGRSFRIGRTVTALVNYVIMPAVLIYTVILYLYAAKITVMWELPKGGIAYMVFAFTIITVAVGAIQYTLERRLYDKYFKYFSFIAIPALILFWTGVVLQDRRIRVERAASLPCRMRGNHDTDPCPAAISPCGTLRQCGNHIVRTVRSRGMDSVPVSRKARHGFTMPANTHGRS